MASQTWAQRAKTAALDDSTPPPPPPARQPPQSNAPAPISKASSSDNWRAGSSRGVPSAGGWIKEEKKEKKGRRPSLSATPRESSQRRAHQSSSSSTTQAKNASTSWATADPTDALPSPTFAPVDLSTTTASPAASSSNLTSSSTTLPADDLIPSLGTPSDSNPSTEPISGTGLSETPSPSTLAAVDSLPPPPPKEKLPAPLPKVNVWSVRKDQLAAAATTAPVTPSSTVPSSAGPHKEKRAAKENSHLNANTSTKGLAAKRNASHLAKSSASSSASSAPTPSSAHPPMSSPLASLDPLPAAARTGSAPSQPPRRGDGWSGLRELASGAAPVGDRESWPAPNEEVPVVKEKSKKAKAAAAKAEQGLEEAAPKKKSDKTKWIAIKVDIRHAGTPSTRAAPAGGEKRVKAPRRDGAADTSKAGAAAGATSTSAGEAKAASTPSTKAANGASAAAGAATTAPVANGKKSNATTRPSPPTGPSTDSRRPLPADFPQKPSTSTLPTSLVNPPPLLSNGSNNAPGTVLRPFSNRTPNPSGTSSTSELRQPGPTPPNPTSKRPDLVDPTAATPTQPARDFASNTFRAAAPRGGRGGSIRGRGVNNRAAYPVRAHVVPTGPFPDYGAPNGADPVVPYASYTPDLAAAAFYPAQIGVPTFPAQSVAPPLLDPYTLDPTRYWLLGQLEWYMSVDNLCRDMFLRTKMDDQGWIEISVIANFNRIKNLTSDHAIVRETMGLTPILEVFGDFVRVRAHWPEWVLPNALPSRVDAKAVAAAAAVAVAAGEDQPASPGKDGEEGPASQGHSSEDDEEGTAPTTVSTGSQAGEETSMQKVVELDQVATELATVTAA